jgi:hypothetical protein
MTFFRKRERLFRVLIDVFVVMGPTGVFGANYRYYRLPPVLIAAYKLPHNWPTFKDAFDIMKTAHKIIVDLTTKVTVGRRCEGDIFRLRPGELVLNVWRCTPRINSDATCRTVMPYIKLAVRCAVRVAVTVGIHRFVRSGNDGAPCGGLDNAPNDGNPCFAGHKKIAKDSLRFFRHLHIRREREVGRTSRGPLTIALVWVMI